MIDTMRKNFISCLKPILLHNIETFYSFQQSSIRPLCNSLLQLETGNQNNWTLFCDKSDLLIFGIYGSKTFILSQHAIMPT